MQRRRHTPAPLAAALILTGLALTACGQKRVETDRIDPATAARLGLSPDAQDPTQRDVSKGYYKWKEKPEAEGTYDPTSPYRRQIGGPNDF